MFSIPPNLGAAFTPSTWAIADNKKYVWNISRYSANRRCKSANPMESSSHIERLSFSTAARSKSFFVKEP